MSDDTHTPTDAESEDLRKTLGAIPFEKGMTAIADFIEHIRRLDEICKIAYSDPHAALDEIEASPYLNHLPWLRSTLMFACCEVIMGGAIKEKDIQERFFERLSEYLPGYKAVKVKTSGGNIPDGFVEIQSKVAPVEVKLNAFDDKALSQLRRYMTYYGSDFGIAVAPLLTCVLPENVTFVQVSM